MSEANKDFFDKFCISCDHQWQGKENIFLCPKCNKEDSYNVVYHILSMGDDYIDRWFFEYEDAEKYFNNLKANGHGRLRLYKRLDNGDIGPEQELLEYWEEDEDDDLDS